MNFNLLSYEVFSTHPLTLFGILLLVWLYKKLCKPFPYLPKIPTGLITIALLLYILNHLVRPLENAPLELFIEVAALVALCLGTIRIVVYLVINYFLEQRRKVKVPTITTDLVLGILWFFTVMVILRQRLNFDLTSLVTTSAVLTAVIGFAMQDTLGNFFAGLAIQAEQPYQIGDWVQIEQHTGEVMGISWRSTRVLTTKRESIDIPNSIISKSAVFNYSKPTPEYIATLELGLAYDAPPNKVRTILLDVLSIHPQILQQRRQEVRVRAFSDFSVTYQIRFWINNYALENKIKSDILNHAWYHLRRAGIRIPFPVREIIQTQTAPHVTPISRVEELLDSIDLFDALGDDGRKILAKRVRTELFGSQEEIVQQNDPGNSLYVIVHGSCRIFVTPSGSTEQRPVAELQAGDFFGEMSLLTGAVRTATVIAEEDTECIVVSKDDVKDLLLAKPEIAQELSKVLAQRQAELDSLQTQKKHVATENAAVQLLNKIWDFIKS
ncbi:MAG: hypothetical protein COV45_00430 [Deltaproteobacteria bacterium CG11_big_fil_rev_8_21_14_0_20_47_16]|nr:MAG: hypothetical protein COV45_00430 [Deltaproteobacteria bacterium CG11_big_fil_rev_8_21_14_0_20_47_16]